MKLIARAILIVLAVPLVVLSQSDEEEEFVELPTQMEAEEEYCSKDIPKDWRPFEFDGQTFFVAPIQMDQA